MTYKSLLLSRPGAVEDTGLDAGVAAHYGEPLREQRALATGTAVVDLSHRGVVTVSGPGPAQLAQHAVLPATHQPAARCFQRTVDAQRAGQDRVRCPGDRRRRNHVADRGERRSWPVGGVAEQDEVHAPRRDHGCLGSVGRGGGTKPVEQLSSRLVWEDPWPHVTPGGYAYSIVPGVPSRAGAPVVRVRGPRCRA
jgi:hypothetical protein